MQNGAATLWGETPDNILVDTNFGDGAATERAFAQAANIVAMDFHIGRVTGVPLEPRAAVANYRDSDRMAVPSSSLTSANTVQWLSDQLRSKIGSGTDATISKNF